MLALMRAPTAMVHTMAILAGYAMLRRMLPVGAALLAAILWAVDPFFTAYSRLLHVDALAGSFATLAVLAACLRWNHGGSRRWLRPRRSAHDETSVSRSSVAVWPSAVTSPISGSVIFPSGRTCSDWESSS